MKRLKMALCVLLAGSSMMLAGCGGGDDGGGGGDSRPGLSTIFWTANGGSALTGAATNGGNGGTVQMVAQGDILNDDGRTRPTVSTNFLSTGVLADNIVTYTELASLGSVAVAAGTATFTLPGGTGFDLAAGRTLDLSDAPSGTVDSVVINSNSEIIIAGLVILTRAASDSVNFSISTSQNATSPILFTGQIQGAGSATRDGGNFSATTTGTTAGVIFLGSGNVSGGLGDAATDGGDAGSVGVSCTGDLLVPVFSVLANGGAGSAVGGNGGAFALNNQAATGNFIAPFNYGLQANGGIGGTGNGGSGGVLQVIGPSTTNTVWCRAEVRGGASTGGNGGPGGQGAVGSATNTTLVGAVSGTFYVTADGGDSVNGNGGQGTLGLLFVGATGTSSLLTGSANGGASTLTGNGGNGGQFQFGVLNLTDCRVSANVNGGNGAVNGGNGGVVALTRAGTVAAASVWTNPTVSGSANGGNGNTGDGGNGGAVIFGQAGGTTIDATGASLSFTANGGTGVNGGNGGTLNADNTNGTFVYTVSFTANGGAANGTAGATTNGGLGGSLTLNNDTGSITASVSASMNGGAGADVAGAGGNGGAFNFTMANGGAGNGTLDISVSGSADGGSGAGTGNAGNGGSLTINPNDSTVTNAGTATVSVNLTLRGGHAIDGAGGNVGTVVTNCGVGGSFTATVFNINVSGLGSDTGDGNTGSPNPWNASFAGPATFNAGTFTALAGNGSIVSGNGNGGGSQDIFIATTGFAITMNLNINLGGGNARGAGDCDSTNRDIDFVLDSDFNGSAGSLTHSGTMSVNAGQAFGSGNGGAGGEININDFGATTGGSVTLNGTYTMNGGNSTSGQGGLSQGLDIVVTGNVTINGSVTMNGGTGNIGGLGGTMRVFTDANIDMNSAVNSIGGNGVSTGGNGGLISLGNDVATQLTIAASAALRANGGTGTTIGTAGTITLDPAGTGGAANANLVESASATIQTNDGAGVDQSGTNVTRD